MIEKRNAIDIFKNVKKALLTDDVILLKEMSNHTVHSASIYQDPESISIAVTVYALSKIIERKKYTTYREWPAFYKRFSKDIDMAITDLEQNNFKKFQDDLKNIRQAIENLSGHLKFYIQDVFRKAEINKASRLYEHGISLGETASLLGITTWELADYTGSTGIADVDLSLTMHIKQRIKNAYKLFEK